MAGDVLAIVTRQRRFRIPSIHMRRRALREDVNNVFRLAGKMRCAWCERGDLTTGSRRLKETFAQQRGKTQRAEPDTGAR